MGQTATCSYWNGPESFEAEAKDDQADLKSSEAVFPPSAICKQANRTGFRTPSSMLKDIKDKESKKESQERWARTKDEWQKRVIAEMEEQDRLKREKELAQASPGTEPDRYGADERQRALQAIKEEEEERRNVAQDLVPAANAEDAKVEKVSEVPQDDSKVETVSDAPTGLPETDNGSSREDQNPVALQEQPTTDMATAQQYEQQDDLGPTPATQDQRSPEEEAARKALLDAFLTKNGFEGVSNKRKRTLRPSIYPLHLAAEKGDAQVVDALLEAGADRLLKDSYGRTPEEVARKKNRKGSHDGVLAALASL